MGGSSRGEEEGERATKLGERGKNEEVERYTRLKTQSIYGVQRDGWVPGRDAMRQRQESRGSSSVCLVSSVSELRLRGHGCHVGVLPFPTLFEAPVSLVTLARRR